MKGKAAYIIVHHGEPIHPSEDLLLIPPGQTIWGTRTKSPLTGKNILGEEACDLTSEDVVTAHAISLFYEEQRNGGYVEREIAALKAEEDMWPQDEQPPESRSLRSEKSGAQVSSKRSLHSIFKPKIRREMFAERGDVDNEKGRNEVCPWEVV